MFTRVTGSRVKENRPAAVIGSERAPAEIQANVLLRALYPYCDYPEVKDEIQGLKRLVTKDAD